MIGLIFLVLGIAQYLYFGYNIFTFALLVLCGLIFGISTALGSRRTRGDIDSRNINDIATIEKNKYFRGK